jgi:methylmalonyl-CoA mutase
LPEGKDEGVEVLKIDNTRVRQQQVELLEKIRATRDNEKVKKALAALEEEASKPKSGNLLALAVDAARVRCTVGEISYALEKSWGRHTPKSQVVMGAYSSSYGDSSGGSSDKAIENVRQRVNSFLEKQGRRPRVLVCKMGQDGHDRGSKVISSGFADVGFDVDVGPLFQTPKEVARMVVDNDVHVVGVSSLAAGHRTLIPQLIEELKKYDLHQNVLVIAGGVIPQQDYDMLYKAGVHLVFGPGTTVLDAANKILDKLEK